MMVSVPGLCLSGWLPDSDDFAAKALLEYVVQGAKMVLCSSCRLD